MKVLVTGGAGFIGSHIADALTARGDEVVVLDDLSSGRRENLAGCGARLVVGDVANLEAVEAAAAGCELIVHQAAIASVQYSVEHPARTNAVNLGGALNVLQAARTVGARRVLLAGSAAVYGDNDDLPLTEDADPRPLSPYAIEKLAAEHYFRVWAPLYQVETVTLRYFNVFGPRQDPSSPYSGVISIFVDRLLGGDVPTIFGDGEQTRDFVFVADVVRANLLAAEAPGVSGGVFNIGCGEQTSVRDLFDQVAELTGVSDPPRSGPDRVGEARRSVANIEAARQALGYQPSVTLREGLAALVSDERARRLG